MKIISFHKLDSNSSYVEVEDFENTEENVLNLFDELNLNYNYEYDELTVQEMDTGIITTLYPNEYRY